jgi:hypothetical protein
LLDNLSKKSGANDAARTPIISLEKISPRKWFFTDRFSMKKATSQQAILECVDYAEGGNISEQNPKCCADGLWYVFFIHGSLVPLKWYCVSHRLSLQLLQSRSAWEFLRLHWWRSQSQ